MKRYYHVPKGTDSYKAIKTLLKKRDSAHEARIEFVCREFPEWSRTDFRLWHSSGRRWGIVPPTDRMGTTFCPDSWKFDKNGPACSPRKGHPKGKLLAKEMGEEKYHVPTCSDFAAALNIEASLQSDGNGMYLFTVGIEVPRANVYVITLHPEQVAPKDCVRITDVEFEAMQKKRKAGAK